MDMNPITWFLFAFAVVNFLGAAAVYLRGSKDKGTIETLTRSNAALTENNKILDERVTLLEAGRTADREKIEAQAHTIEVLTNTVNSADLIRSLDVHLTSNHKAAMIGLKEIHTDLSELRRLGALIVKKRGQDGTPAAPE